MDGENAMPTYCLGKELMKRIRAYDKGTHDGSVDVDMPDRVVREIGDESKRARWRERHVVRRIESSGRARAVVAASRPAGKLGDRLAGQPASRLV